MLLGEIENPTKPIFNSSSFDTRLIFVLNKSWKGYKMYYFRLSNKK